MKAAIVNFYYKLIGKKKGYCCKDCFKNLYHVLDKEASKEQEAHFMKHIDECSYCFKLYEIDKSVKEVIKMKIEHKSVPPTLINSIKNKINQHS